VACGSIAIECGKLTTFRTTSGEAAISSLVIMTILVMGMIVVLVIVTRIIFYVARARATLLFTRRHVIRPVTASSPTQVPSICCNAACFCWLGLMLVGLGLGPGPMSA
jgi:hypothetical protein